MSKYASNLAYIEEGQCNDAPPGRRSEDAAAVVVIPERPRQARPGPLQQLFDIVVALLTFGAQVAGVFFVIVLIAKYVLR